MAFSALASAQHYPGRAIRAHVRTQNAEGTDKYVVRASTCTYIVAKENVLIGADLVCSISKSIQKEFNNNVKGMGLCQQ